MTNDQLREVFDMVDVDKGGTLDKDEVGRPDMRCLHPCICVFTAAIPHHHLDQYQCAAEVEGDPDGLYIGGDGAQLLQQWEAGDGTRGSGRNAYHGCRRQWRGTGACTINRPCAQKYVVKSQSCMVTSGRLIVHAPVQRPTWRSANTHSVRRGRCTSQVIYYPMACLRRTTWIWGRSR